MNPIDFKFTPATAWRIRRSSALHQWKYVATNLNPAYLATWSIQASKLKESTWHTGPKFLYKSLTTVTNDRDTDAEILPDDPELRKDSNVLVTHVEVCSTIGSERFSGFSDWSTVGPYYLPVSQPVRYTLKSLSLWILRALLMHSAYSYQ